MEPRLSPIQKLRAFQQQKAAPTDAVAKLRAFQAQKAAPVDGPAVAAQITPLPAHSQQYQTSYQPGQDPVIDPVRQALANPSQSVPRIDPQMQTAAPNSTQIAQTPYGQPEPTPRATLGELARNVGAGAVQTGADIIQNIPVTLSALGRAAPQSPGAPPAYDAQRDPQAALQARREDMIGAVQTSLDDEGPVAAIANRVREFTPDTDPAVQDQFTVQIARALGSTAPFFLSAIGGPLAVAGAGASAGAGETIGEARAAGVTDASTIDTAVGQGALAGSSEVIPVERAIKRLTPFLGPLTGQVVQGVMEEFGQETLQRFVQNVAARDSFDPDRELTDDLLESGTAGGVVGGLISAVLGAGGKARGRFQQQPNAQPPQTPQGDTTAPLPQPAPQTPPQQVPDASQAVPVPPGPPATVDVQPPAAPADTQSPVEPNDNDAEYERMQEFEGEMISPFDEEAGFDFFDPDVDPSQPIASFGEGRIQAFHDGENYVDIRTDDGRTVVIIPDQDALIVEAVMQWLGTGEPIRNPVIAKRMADEIARGNIWANPDLVRQLRETPKLEQGTAAENTALTEPSSPEAASEAPSPAVSPEAELSRVANESTDAEEIELAYRTAQDFAPVATPEQEAIADFLGRTKVARSSFEQFGDPNTLTTAMKRAYLRAEGASLDTAAQELSTITGTQIEPQDIVDFIDQHPGGLSDYRQAQRSPLAERLAERYKEVTGKAIPAQSADVDMGPMEEAPFAPERDLAATAGASTDEIADASKEWREKGTDSKYFRKWFGESKVVDARGKPLAVYHGTPDARALNKTGVFKTQMEQFASILTPGAADPARLEAQRSYFFTDNKATARSYAKDKTAFDYQGAVPDMFSVYLSIKNPMVVNAEGSGWGKRGGYENQVETLRKAKEAGHDGLIIKNTRDTYNDTDTAPTSTIYVAFSPGQIKSSTDNTGAFRTDSPSMFETRVRSLDQGKSSQQDAPTGREADRIKPDPITGRKPKRLTQIRLDLESLLGVKVRTAKTRRRAAGTYFPGNSRTIIKYTGDLDTMAHEVAHALDDQFNIVGEWAGKGLGPTPSSPYDAELIPKFSHTGSGGPKKSLTYNRAEGVAEWVRAWIVNPDEAEAAAPKFSAFFKSKVPQDVQDALKEFSFDVRVFAGATPEQRTIANVERSANPKKVVKRVADVFRAEESKGIPWVDGLKRDAVDRLHPVMQGYEYARRVRGIEEVVPSKDAKILIRLFAGIDSKVDDMFDKGPIDTQGKRIPNTGGIKWLFAPLDNSTAESLEADIEATTALLINERVIEQAEKLDKAAAIIETSADELAEMPALIREQKERIDKASDKLEELRRRSVRDGSIGKQKEILVFERKELRKLIAEREELKATIAEQKQKIGYTGSPANVKKWVELRKQRLSGTGGGVYSDTKTAYEAVRDAQADPERYARIREAADRYRTWTNGILKYYRDKGRISAEQYTQITKENQQYVSMQRLFEDADPQAARAAGRQLGRVANPIKRFRGSTREIQDPYISLMLQTATMVREADRNEALRAFTDPLRSNRAMYEGEVLKLERVGRQVTSQDKDTILIYNNGEAEYWQFDEDIHQALKGFGDALPSSTLYKAIAALPRMTRTFITHSPPFIVRNLMRDAPQRGVVSRSGSKPWGHLYFLRPGGAKEFDNLLSDLHKFGGGQFGWYGSGKESYNARLQQAVKDLSGDTTIFSTPKRIGAAYMKLAKLSEDSGRVAEYQAAYKQAKKKGMSDYDAGLYAAYEARDILDYAVSGRIVRHINMFVPFTNAAIQGLSRMYTSVKEHPFRTIARWGYYVVTMEMANYVWNYLSGDDEELRQQPSYVRDLFWNYKIGPNKWLRIPKPWEMGVLASGISRGMDYARGDKNAFDGWTTSMFNALTPVDESALFGPFVRFAEVMANYDFFRRKAIVSTWEEDLDLDLREGTEHASRVSKILQDVVGMDARNIDHLIEGTFGGVGRMGTTISDLGRDEKNAGDQLIIETSGILLRSPVYAARDVQWVMDWAKKKGKRTDKRVKTLNDMLKLYYNAKTDKEKDVLGKKVRDYASRVRSQLDQ